MELKDQILKYREIQNVRRALEEKAKELKEQLEAPLKLQILQTMHDEGMQSLHFPEVGRVISSTRSHYEIVDKEAFALAMLRSITTAAQEGRPLSEAMLAQNRPSKEIFEDYLQHMGVAAESCGVRKVEQPELYIRK